MCKIDLKDAYFSVPLQKDSRKLVRFLWAGNLYEFLCLCLGSGPDPRIFTKLLKIPISVLRHLMIRAIIYLDDLLILGNSMSEIFTARDSVCDLPIATSRLCNKSEEVCVRSCTRNRVLWVDCEFPNYDFVITKGKDSEDKRSMPEFIQSIRGITYNNSKFYP